MAQVKIYGSRERLAPRRAAVPAGIHMCVVEALQLPPDKKFQRFILLEREDFLFPADRSDDYIILEISLFEGRSEDTKKQLISRLCEQLARDVGIVATDIEITIFETPRHNRGIRGHCDDELPLSYRVDI